MRKVSGEFHLRTGVHSSFRKRIVKLLEGAVRTCLIAVAVGIGVGLGVRTQTLHAALGQLRASDPPLSRPTVAAVPARQTDYDPPAGYTLLGITRIASGSYAMLAADEPSETTSQMGSGAAEVFDSDGRLLMRYQATEGTDSQWRVTEFVRLPVEKGSAGGAGK